MVPLLGRRLSLRWFGVWDEAIAFSSMRFPTGTGPVPVPQTDDIRSRRFATRMTFNIAPTNGTMIILLTYGSHRAKQGQSKNVGLHGE